MKFLLSIFTLLSLSSVYAEQPQELKELKEHKILFIGDSLTEGYGVAKEQAYPSLVQDQINDEGKFKIRTINAGVSGSTTSSGLERLNWQIKSKPSILFVALGANDGLRGIPVKTSKSNLEKIIKTGIDKNMKVILGGMLLPQNYGKEYRDQFSNMYKDLAKKYNLTFIPFILEGVARVKELNIEDGIHPNAKGHKKMANVVKPYILKVLKTLD